MTDLFDLGTVRRKRLQLPRRSRIGLPAQQRQRPWWLPAVIAAALALIPGGYLAYRDAQLHAFRSAPSCGRVETDNCWYGVVAIVQWVHYTDDTTTYLKVVADPPADKPIQFEEASPLLDEIDTGDAVFVEIWHGKVWKVRHGDTTEYTSAAVRYIPCAALATVALLIVALILLIRPRWRGRGRYPMRVLYLAWMTWAVSTAALFGLFAPLTLIGTNPSTIWTIAWPLVSVGTGLGLLVLIAGGIRVWRWTRHSARPDLVSTRWPRHATAPELRPKDMRLIQQRRSRREERFQRYSRVIIVIGLVVVTIMGLAIYPNLKSVRDAYAMAPMCPPATWRYDCRSTSIDYVVEAHVTSGRSASQSIDLGFGHHVGMPDSARSFVSGLHPGDPIAVELWHATVVRAGYPTPAFATDGNPKSQLALDQWLAFTCLIVCMIVFVVIRRRRAGPRANLPRWWRIDAPLAILVAVADTLLVEHQGSGAVVGGIALAAMAATAYAPRRWIAIATGPSSWDSSFSTDTDRSARV